MEVSINGAPKIDDLYMFIISNPMKMPDLGVTPTLGNPQVDPNGLLLLS